MLGETSPTKYDDSWISIIIVRIEKMAIPNTLVDLGFVINVMIIETF